MEAKSENWRHPPLIASTGLSPSRPVKLAISGKQRAEMDRRNRREKEWKMERRLLGRKGGSLRPPPEEMRRKAEEGRVCGGRSVCECQSSSACQTSVIDHKPTQPSNC